MGYSVYKAEDFIATSDMTLGYNKRLNRYTGTFITTIADRVRGKYNFGYKRSATRLSKEIITLPIDSNGMPDWTYMENFMRNIENTSNLGVYVGRKSTFEISSRPYLTKDLALRPCFRIFIGLTYISLCSPTRYAHTKAMQTIANRRAMRSLSRRWVSSILKPEDFMARNAVSISQRFL